MSPSFCDGFGVDLRWCCLGSGGGGLKPMGVSLEAFLGCLEMGLGGV